jgi:hypothetical protein
VYKFYHDKRQQAQSGCRLELETQGAEGSSCAALDNLERMVYEVAFSGDAEQLYHVLRVSACPCAELQRAHPLPLPALSHGVNQLAAHVI